MNLDDEGYEIIPPLKPNRKGVKCGKCLLKFDDGVAYGYWCPNMDCPIMVKAR